MTKNDFSCGKTLIIEDIKTFFLLLNFIYFIFITSFFNIIMIHKTNNISNRSSQNHES
jgi:hypothetical protein